jgi:PD-(D/E)XK nuclease superfamily
MKFMRYEPLPVENTRCTVRTLNGNRFYEKDGISLPSVTSVLSATMSPYKRQAIDNYKARVADAEALWARQRDYGTSFHEDLERILQARKSYVGHLFEPELATWDRVLLTEYSMHAPKTQVAGTFDCLAINMHGEYLLVDFKTTGKKRTKSFYKDYFTQLGLYSLMIKEVLGIEINKSIILVNHNCTETWKPLSFYSFAINGDELKTYQKIALDKVQEYYDLFAF